MATTQKEKILNALRSNDALSAVQLRKQTQATQSGLTARITELRQAGYAIMGYKTKDGQQKYSLASTPNSAMVAAAYRQAGASVFTW